MDRAKLILALSFICILLLACNISAKSIQTQEFSGNSTNPFDANGSNRVIVHNRQYQSDHPRGTCNWCKCNNHGRCRVPVHQSFLG